MPQTSKVQTDNEIVTRMIELAAKKYNCSQLMLILAMEQEARENPGLVRAMSGLANGCGFFHETCGIMTGAACLISWYAGKGQDNEEESEHLLPMLQDLGDWFRMEIGDKYNGTKCMEIVGDMVGTPEGKQICGGIIFRTYQKTMEILRSHDFA